MKSSTKWGTWSTCSEADGISGATQDHLWGTYLTVSFGNRIVVGAWFGWEICVIHGLNIRRVASVNACDWCLCPCSVISKCTSVFSSQGPPMATWGCHHVHLTISSLGRWPILSRLSISVESELGVGPFMLWNWSDLVHWCSWLALILQHVGAVSDLAAWSDKGLALGSLGHGFCLFGKGGWLICVADWILLLDCFELEEFGILGAYCDACGVCFHYGSDCGQQLAFLGLLILNGLHLLACLDCVPLIHQVDWSTFRFIFPGCWQHLLAIGVQHLDQLLRGWELAFIPLRLETCLICLQGLLLLIKVKSIIIIWQFMPER